MYKLESTYLQEFLARTEEICTNCGCIENVFFSKHVFRNKTFHWKLYCFDCYKRWYIKREGSKLFKVGETMPWVKDSKKLSKAVAKEIKRLRKKQLTLL